VTLNLSPAVPVSSTDDDLAAARRQDLLVNRLFLDPLLAGVYPADYDEVWGHLTDRSFVRPGDLAVISTPVDFLGVNYYFRIHVRKGTLLTESVVEGAIPNTAFDVGVVPETPAGLVRTGLDWPVEPDGLYEALSVLRDRFPSLPPVYVTDGLVHVDYETQVRTPKASYHWLRSQLRA